MDRKSYHQMRNQDDTDKFWATVPLFQRLPAESLPGLTQASERVEYKAGATIIRQGEAGNEFFVIQRGTARVDIDDNVLTELKGGDYFGEAALLRNEPRAASITAVTPVIALKISRQTFQRLGLHEKLEFPKREKVKNRHKFLAAGTAGVKLETKTKEWEGGFAQPRRSEKQGEKKGFWKVQCEAFREIFCDPLNASVLVLVPIGQLCKYMEYSPGIIFFSNFFAIIPLASILGAATEALAAHTGQLLGGLLNATFGNAVEMIMCVQTVKAGYISVVQGNLLGSILSNLLLVLGMAVFGAGIARKAQEFNAKGAAANMTCLYVASISVVMPTCFGAMAGTRPDEVVIVSRICSVFLMILYVMFLYFMLKTHAELFADEEHEEEEEEGLSATFSAILLFGCTLVVFMCSECLVDSIEGVTEQCGLSKAFIGLILLPIVGNAAEHVTAVSSAYKGMMDLALGVAVGSSTQIALFVVPCAVMFGWVYDQPMNLEFTVFDVACQVLSVFLVSQVLSHGETTWLHGAMLMIVYVFVAVQTFFMHGQQE